jgi:hypothetical protein
MQITYVVLIATTQDVNKSFVYTSCVAPSSRGKATILAKSEFLALNLRHLSIWLNEVRKVKHIYIVEVHIFTVATTEGNYLVWTYRRCGVESLCLE